MIAIGVDIGIHRIAMAVPEAGWYGQIDLAGAYIGRRDTELRELQRWVRTRVMTRGVTPVAFIERPFLSGSAANPTTTIGMAETVGIIRASVIWTAPSTMVNPSSWKKALVGKGNATKEEARYWLEDTIGKEKVDSMSEDEVDAMCIGYYGQGVIDGEISLPQPAAKKRRKRAG